MFLLRIIRCCFVFFDHAVDVSIDNVPFKPKPFPCPGCEKLPGSVQVDVYCANSHFVSLGLQPNRNHLVLIIGVFGRKMGFGVSRRST